MSKQKYRFIKTLNQEYPDLVTLLGLLKDKVPEFLTIFAGKTIYIPSREELKDLAIKYGIREELEQKHVKELLGTFELSEIIKALK